jgi:glycosyltransferase involved in cell wall biosynthesis
LYGSDRVMLDTATALVQRGWRVAVAVPEDGPLVAPLKSAGATVELCPTPVLRKAALQDPLAFLRLVRDALAGLRPGWNLISSTNPDVVYVSTVTVPLWILLARLRRRPVVGHVHEAEQAAPHILRAAMATPLLAADEVLLNSQFSLDVLTDALPRLRRRCRVVLNSVRGPGHPTPARSKLEPPLRVLYVGRLNPRKGPQLVIEAATELCAAGVDVQVSVAGSAFRGYEDFEAELHRKVADGGLSERVRFLGFCPDVWPLLADADVAVVPSIVPEPFGNTAVEAVLAARPVVASTAGGLPEAVEGYAAAVSVQPGDSHAIAEALRSIVVDWEQFRSGALADSKIAAERHDPERYADEIVASLTAAARV